MRVLLEIFTVFGAKASGWADGENKLRCLLSAHSFPSFGGKVAVVVGCTSASIAEAWSMSHFASALVKPLDPYLEAVGQSSLGEKDRQGQLPLVEGLGSIK